MRFALTEEQELLADTVRQYLAARSPIPEVRARLEDGDGFDQDLWKSMAVELGLQGMVVDERHGGMGYSTLELALVLEEMGRALYPGPFLASSVAAAILSEFGPSDLCDVWLPRLADATSIAAVVLPDGRPHAAAVDAHAVDGTISLRGDVGLVADAHRADLLLVPVSLEGSVKLVAVETSSGVTSTQVDGFDRTRGLSNVSFQEVSGIPFEGPDDTAALTRAWSLTALGLAAEQAGAARTCLDMSVEYAKIREQFGRAIGSFQAVKHLCADMFVGVQAAQSAVRYAAWTAEHRPDEFPRAARIARVVASDSANMVTAAAVQVHGGIGFTWEHDAHLFVKRVKSNSLLLGDVAEDVELLAGELLATR